METNMNAILKTLTLSSFAVIGLSGCDAAKDALSADPQTSYCEAVCDWAVECSGDTSALDACLEATRATNDNCAAAENGELDPANSKLVEDCVATVEADSCDGLTGSVEDQGTAAPSSECIASEGPTVALDAYNEARTSQQAAGDDFCEDLGGSICANVVDCMIGDLGVDEATDALQAACEASAVTALVSTCQDVDLEPAYGADANVNRMSANVCAQGVNGLADSCDVFSGDAWPAECAAVVVEADALPGLVGNLITFAEEYGVTP